MLIQGMYNFLHRSNARWNKIKEKIKNKEDGLGKFFPKMSPKLVGLQGEML